MVSLAEMLIPAGNPERLFRIVGPEAFALADALGDNDLACRACIETNRSGGSTIGQRDYPGSEPNRKWVGELDRHAKPGTTHRVWADVALSHLLLHEGRVYESWQRDIA